MGWELLRGRTPAASGVGQTRPLEDTTMIHLSPPDVGARERDALLSAFDSGWIAPLGPDVDAFEVELARYVSAPAAAVLSSGTAALHLALIALGVAPGEEVVVQTSTFAATAFAVVHANAVPVFCDISRDTWNLDPQLLEEFLQGRARTNRLPRAVIAVDLYGLCPDYERLQEVCARFDVLLVEDAAEALGSRSRGRSAGTFGTVGVFSFNGNKMITTGGGGALVGSSEVVDLARRLASQARLPTRHYEHDRVGFNYRMSNLAAALGRAQLTDLESKVQRRAAILARYQDELPAIETWLSSATTERSNCWLSVGLLPPGVSPSDLCELLAKDEIEARPAWKPMHAQPVFSGATRIGGAVADELFDRGICLPSGSSLTDEEQTRVIDALASYVWR